MKSVNKFSEKKTMIMSVRTLNQVGHKLCPSINHEQVNISTPPLQPAVIFGVYSPILNKRTIF